MRADRGKEGTSGRMGTSRLLLPRVRESTAAFRPYAAARGGLLRPTAQGPAEERYDNAQRHRAAVSDAVPIDAILDVGSEL